MPRVPVVSLLAEGEAISCALPGALALTFCECQTDEFHRVISNRALKNDITLDRARPGLEKAAATPPRYGGREARAA